MPRGELQQGERALAPEDRPTVAERTSRPSALPALPRLEPGEVVARRFEVLELLGQGGYAEVYRVHDRRRDRQMALKIHRVGALGPRARSALEAEFQLLSGLRHPHLVAVEEFGVAEGHYAWLSQAHVPGVPLHRASAPILSPRGIGWLAQLLRALDFLHGRGFVHGDVKPNNILVDDDEDRLVLLDFGVARTLGAVAPQFEGSPDYMSPEVLHGLGSDGRADLYALGCTLHTLIQGKPPFYRETVRETFLAHMLAEPPPLPASVPGPIREWVERLLQKQPDDRFPSAWDALRALGSAAGRDFHRDTPATLASHVARAPLVGRGAILDELEACAASNEGPIVCLEGPAGTGKTRVLEELRRSHQVEGGRFLQVRGYRARETTWLELARAIVDPHEARGLDAMSRRTLAHLLPELREDGRRLDAPMDPDGAARRRLELLAVMLARRSRRQRLIVVIEDIHRVGWNEQARIAELFETARMLRFEGMLVVTTRPGGLSPDWPTGDHVRQLVLDPLDPAATRTIVDALVGHGAIVGTELEARLFAKPRTPFETREAIRLLVDEGRLVRGATGRFERVGELPWREPHETIRARLQRLDRQAMAVALGLAVWSRPATSPELARLARLSASETARALAQLLQRGMAQRVERFGRRPTIVLGEAYVEAVLQLSPPKRRRAVARRAAAEALRGSTSAVDLARAAAHLEAADEEAKAAAHLHRASRAAESDGRPDVALALSRNIARLERTPDPARILREHDLALRLGRLDDVAAAIAMAHDLGAPEGELAWREALGDLRAGRLGLARERCLAWLPRSRAETRLRLLEVLGRAEALSGQMEQSRLHFLEATALARELGADPAPALLGCAIAEQRLGYGRSASTAREAVAAARASGDGAVLSDAERVMGSAHRARGDRRGAARALWRAVSLARARGDLEREARAMVELGRVAHDRGHPLEAVETWEHAIDLSERVGSFADAMLTRVRLARTLKACGRRAEALEQLLPVLEQEGAGLRVAVGLAWSQRGDLHALEGEEGRALEAYDRADALLASRAEERSQVVAGRMRAHLRLGEVGRAETDWMMLALIADPTERPVDRRRHAVCAARLAEERGDLATALEHARAAARIRHPRRVHFDVHGTHLEALWLVARALHGLGRSTSRASARARRALERYAEGVAHPEGGRLFAAATPTRRAIAAGDLRTRW